MSDSSNGSVPRTWKAEYLAKVGRDGTSSFAVELRDERVVEVRIGHIPERPEPEEIASWRSEQANPESDGQYWDDDR